MDYDNSINALELSPSGVHNSLLVLIGCSVLADAASCKITVSTFSLNIWMMCAYGICKTVSSSIHAEQLQQKNIHVHRGISKRQSITTEFAKQ